VGVGNTSLPPSNGRLLLLALRLVVRLTDGDRAQRGTVFLAGDLAVCVAVCEGGVHLGISRTGVRLSHMQFIVTVAHFVPSGCVTRPATGISVTATLIYI
jgi:hypothetical protein